MGSVKMNTAPAVGIESVWGWGPNSHGEMKKSPPFLRSIL